MALISYCVHGELRVGDSGDTLDVLKRRLAEKLAADVRNGLAKQFNPETNLIVYGGEREHPDHCFDPAAISYHVYRHGGIPRLFASYTFTLEDEATDV